jgi:hypothetical protein
MANENARRDANRVTTALGVTNDAAQETRNLLIDPATGALLVTLGGGGGAPITGAENGLYVSGMNVRLGTNPLIENTTIDGASTFSIDFPNMVNFTGDVTTEFDITRGNLKLFNSTTGVFGADSVGFSETVGTETLANYLQSGTNATMAYFDSATNEIRQIRVNSGSALLNAQAPTISNQVSVGTSNINIAANTGGVFADIDLTNTTIDIDVTTGTLFINEGTTASGANTATNGMVLQLQDASTGEVQYANVTPDFSCKMLLLVKFSTQT